MQASIEVKIISNRPTKTGGFMQGGLVKEADGSESHVLIVGKLAREVGKTYPVRGRTGKMEQDAFFEDKPLNPGAVSSPVK